jgi:serine/threonine-protein kinase SRPK3
MMSGSDRPNAEDNGLMITGPPFGLEKIYDYEFGGHHPVHLDVLHARYRVIHKLGSGGYANVWLCKDTSSPNTCSFVAAKIITAEGSTDGCPELRVTKLEALVPQASAELFCLPLDRFNIEGPMEFILSSSIRF